MKQFPYLDLEASVPGNRGSSRARAGNSSSFTLRLPLQSGVRVTDILALPEVVQGLAHGVELAVGLLEREHLDLVDDGVGGEDALAGAEVGEDVGLGVPAVVLGVAEVGGLVIPEAREHGDVEGRHHVLVLVDQVVAVEHVQPRPGLVVRLHPHRLPLRQPDHVFQAVRLVRLHAAVPARPRDHPEVHEVHVDRVRPAAGAVLELPDLDGAAGHLGQHAVGHVLEADPVDEPLPVLPVELEVVVDAGGLGREGDGAELCGDCGWVVDWPRGDVEAHHFVRVGEVVVYPEAADVFEVAELDLLPGEGGEVEDYFVAFGDGDEL